MDKSVNKINCVLFPEDIIKYIPIILLYILLLLLLLYIYIYIYIISYSFYIYNNTFNIITIKLAHYKSQGYERMIKTI